MGITNITKARDYLGKEVAIEIDRALYSKHPKHGFEYKLNYGFVPDTLSLDGEELDAYVIGVNTPVDIFKGKCIAVIHRTNDNDDKLVVVTEDMSDITEDEIRTATHFQEQFFKSEIIR